MDNDGCVYLDPTPHLEDAIDKSMLMLLESKHKSRRYGKAVSYINSKYQELDKLKIVPNLHNQNTNGITEVSKFDYSVHQSFTEIMEDKDNEEAKIFAARALGKMLLIITRNLQRLIMQSLVFKGTNRFKDC